MQSTGFQTYAQVAARAPKVKPRRVCDHSPEQGTVEIDDTDGERNLYVGTCATCGDWIRTDYTSADAHDAAWYGEEGR